MVALAGVAVALPWLPLGTALVCLLITILLVVTGNLLLDRAERVQQLAARRTAELERAYESVKRESEDRLP
jgi:uncharacterized membrane protein